MSLFDYAVAMGWLALELIYNKLPTKLKIKTRKD